MVTEWDFPLEEVLDPHLTRLMDHHPEADLGQGHQSYQDHQGRCRYYPDHQGRCCHRLDHQGCYMLITCYEAIE